MMKVSTLMTKMVHTCSPYDTLDRVARIMWENDLGALPVVDETGRTTGMVTDRDLCMAAYTQGKALAEIPVWIAASTSVIAAHPDDSLDVVHDRMRAHRVRRLPVLGERGEPVGIVSMGDLARAHVTNGHGTTDALAYTLAAIAQPHGTPIEGPVYRIRSEDGGWDVIDGKGARVAAGLRAQSDAIAHAKELAKKNGSAEIVVYDDQGAVASQFFYMSKERSSLATDGVGT